jgi:putative hemolysin
MLSSLSVHTSNELRFGESGRGVALAFETDQFSVRILTTGGRGGPIVEPEIREAQQLRHAVFTGEYGAHLSGPAGGIDEDIYDAWCDHLIVRDKATGQVVGTYRIVRPEVAARLGYYADTEFFTNRLASIKPNLLEFGRSCIHADFRSGPVIMLLWTALARYMIDGGYEHVMGCASVSLRDGGHQAASLFDRLERDHPASPEFRVFPRNPLPLDGLTRTLAVDAPPLVKGYLRLGAQVCGDPAWDRDFNTADFFMLLSLSKMNPRYAKHFGIAADAMPFVEQRRAA